MLNFKEKIKEEVFMSTPHNQANKGDIAKTVLMPGDPLRAKYLAETYLENVKQFNATRSMFGYTGTYKGKEVSIMGSGMGMPSIGIYSYELFQFYDVENIIRIGSCGSFKEDVRLRDIIIVQGACTDSNYAHQYELPGTYSAISDYSLLEKAVEKAKEKNGKSAEKDAENSTAEQETPADDTVKSEDGELVFSTTTELDD